VEKTVKFLIGLVDFQPFRARKRELCPTIAAASILLSINQLHCREVGAATLHRSRAEEHTGKKGFAQIK